MARLVLGALAAVCFCGCVPFVPVPFVCPMGSYTPPLRLEAPDQVHAFRVDVRRDVSCVEFNRGDTYALGQMGVWPGGWLLPQARLTADYGWVWNCIALVFDKHIHHTHHVRLYRPGHELVEIQSWQLDKAVQWKQATNLAAQEKAVDDLLATPGWRQDLLKPRRSADGQEEGRAAAGPWGFEQLAPGSHAGAHRQALRFAASEYERLAASEWPKDEATLPVLERLLAKATWLRELAAR